MTSPRNLLLVVALAYTLACACAQTPCFARITAVARAGSTARWTAGATTYQVWDITATNEGTCALTRIVGYFSPTTGSITESWNYDSSSGLITGYGYSLPVGVSFTGAGFVLANATQPVLAFDRPACVAGCSDSTTAPTSVPTTTTPTTTTPTTTAAPIRTTTTTTPIPISTTTTSAPTQTVRRCVAQTLVRAEGNSWTDSQGRNTSVYRLQLSNAGPCNIQSIALNFVTNGGAIVSTFNLNARQGGGYDVANFGSSLAAGSAYSGAGLIVAGGNGFVNVEFITSVCGTSCLN